jgi:hypothetical protein
MICQMFDEDAPPAVRLTPASVVKEFVILSFKEVRFGLIIKLV